MSYIKLLAAGLMAALLVGCSQPTIPDPEPTDTTYGDSGASTGGMGDGGLGAGEFIEDPSAGELGTVIYFDFDSSEVRPQDQDLVSRHAMQLGQNTRLRVRLEGHADERGSREYNIGLGERRSQAVRQMLMIQGVSGSQISTVSFGEERPASFGSAEMDYAQNRRVEIRYTN
ncbi:MAG: peptidoglycan-associated lipoprotein Pal [Gammaproteobacteria bacterium]|nr:peptidoglycan-associated lipoprotein Pal [Gammaproteobacteria bacterium]MBT8111099.1 peptidoglycan-associated lipoprotein Pal [Gammaproteobacteria bacterium]NND48016.1 peptidoglycan-associated lipoprotein Pal [Woeseiaceae bacterium]NNL45797.1 peptidoglycan-associated lipoprotein Pal [Woeseiaceae bacterium]